MLGPVLISAGALGWRYFPNDAEFAPVARQAVIITEKIALHTDAARTAYPSTALFTKGGTDSPATTGAASTQPTADRTGTTTGAAAISCGSASPAWKAN